MDKILQCKICKFEGMSLTTHLKFKHNLSTTEYKKMYGECRLYIHSDELKRKISSTLKKLNEDEDFRKLNSERQKNGASCLTITYWLKRGFSEDEAKDRIKKLQTINASKSVLKGRYDKRSILCKQYWLDKGKTETEAIELIKQHQIKASAKSSKFKGHVRSDESKRKISNTIQKKIKLYGFANTNGTSKLEKEFYGYIKENIDIDVQANVKVNYYIVDVLKNKKIIEFYGDYWHCNPKFYKSGDLVKFKKTKNWVVDYIWNKNNERIDNLKSMGYDVLIIWEYDWKQNRNECINQIKDFLI